MVALERSSPPTLTLADHLTVFRVSRRTGGLKFTGHYVPVGNPSAVVFLDLAKGN